jgi:hypothetical protein
MAISYLCPLRPHTYYAGRKMANQQPARASSLIAKSARLYDRGERLGALSARK